MALLFGRLPRGARRDERDILVEVDAVRRALDRLGYRTVVVELSLDLRRTARRLVRAAPGAVFNLVDSVEGSERLQHLGPALLDSLGIPYTGTRTEGIVLANHKLRAKALMASAGIPTPPWLPLQATEMASFPPPYIVKSIWENGSVGISDAAVVREAGRSTAELAALLDRPAAELFAEAFVDGREFNVSLLAGVEEVEVLPVAEMTFQGYAAGKPRIVGYAAKWEEGTFEFGHTVRRFDLPGEDAPLLERLRELALACWRALELRGHARVDFRVSADGEPWVLEANANPCLSPGAGYMAAAARAGLSPEEVVRRILMEGAGSEAG